MKTYNHLYEEYISDKNILKAIHDCKSRKRSHALIDRMQEDPEHWIPIVRKWATNFHSAKHTPKVIYDGISRKKRKILIPTDKEQVVHHMLMNVFEPIMMQGIYYHAYGSITGRGPDKCKKYIEHDIKHKKKVKYFLKADIRKFYNSIDTSILKEKLRKIIKDERYLAVLEEVINVQPVGLPLGFYTSQLLAQFYLKDMDRYIKEDLKAPYYYRYVDDIVVHSNNKRQLHRICDGISEYLEKELNLHMKYNWQVFRFDYVKNGTHYGRDLDFLGYRFYSDRTVFRRSLMLKTTRKAKRIAKKKRFTAFDARQMMSYMAKVKHSDTYNMYLTRIKPYVKVKRCKKKISSSDKQREKEKKLLCGTNQNPTSNQS